MDRSRPVRRHPPFLAVLVTTLLVGVLEAPTAGLVAQTSFSIADVLSPGFPRDLVAARDGDRIAWIEYERGMRNVWTAGAPEYTPVRLTAWTEDDGRDLGDLRISDDGSLVVFVRGHEPNDVDWIANPTSRPEGAERAVWATRTDGGGDPWKVAEAWSFALSPDGEWIAWEEDGQIHATPVDPGAGGPPRRGASEPLVRAWGENGDPVWSPDSRHIAFESNREDHRFVGVYDTRHRTVTWLAPGVDRDDDPTWSPDGSRVAFLRRPGLPFGQETERAWWRRGSRPDSPPEWAPPGLFEAHFAGGHDLEIWVADARTGKGRRVWHTQPGDSILEEIREIRWAGNRLLFEAEPLGWRQYWAVAADGSDDGAEPTLLTPGEGMVEFVDVPPDGRWLYYATNAGDIDRRHLWRVPVDGDAGDAERLTRGDGIETYPTVPGRGGRVALLGASARRPLSVGLVDAGGGDVRWIAPRIPERFPTERHVVPEAVTLEAEDGFEFYNQLFLPPDLAPGERRPALIFIHGGSRRQMLLGYHYMHFYHMAYAMNQYFASRGYVVLAVNYRSGIGYGREFRERPDYGPRGNSEYLDIRAAGRYLASRDDVDPERVGLWGLSYGGILTAQGLARDSDLFRAGVDMAGVHLWGDALNPDSTSYRASSISEVESWTSPVLLIQGDDDRNVDFSQTVGLVQLLRANEVPYELIVFPDEVHDFLLHSRWLLAFGATDDFFRRAMLEGQAIGQGFYAGDAAGGAGGR
ncbi:MAG: prolyl oligopeptidase family serine peptidase [Gemmatimonadota bacterium]|jgi:dipeptidyl aminopeptidase/acylaminoacyl peptidase